MSRYEVTQSEHYTKLRRMREESTHLFNQLCDLAGRRATLEARLTHELSTAAVIATYQELTAVLSAIITASEAIRTMHDNIRQARMDTT